MEPEQLPLTGLKQVQLAAVREILRATAAALPIEEIIPIIANVTIIAFDALTTWVMLADEGRLRTVVARGEGAAALSGTTCDLGAGPAGAAAGGDRPAILAPQHIDPADPVIGGLARQPAPVVLVPIRANGQTRGLLGAVIALDATEDLTFLATLAEQAAIVIEDAQLRAEVRTWRERLGTVFEQMNDAVLVYNREGDLVIVNPAGERLLQARGVRAGDSLAEFAQKAGLRDACGALIPLPALACARALRGEVVDNQEEQILDLPDGSERHLLTSAMPLWRDSQINGVVVVYRDITQRRQAEQALHESAARFRVVQEHSLYGLTMLQSVRDDTGAVVDFVFEYLNPVAEQISGHSSAALRGKRLLELFPESRTSGFFDRYRMVAETGTPQEFEGYYDARRTKGWFRNMVVKLGDGIAISYSDITVAKRAEAEWAELLAREQAARAEAQEAVRMRDAFLAIAAHELKNPLTSLQGQAQLLQRHTARDGTLSERDRRVLESILEQAGRLSTMITDLLDHARIERGQLQIAPRPIDLAALVRRLVDTLPALPARYRISCRLPDAPVPVLGDTLRLEQVIQNLLNNAIKYSPGGGVIRLSLERDAAAVLIISDEGIGIPAEAIAKLFQPFYRAENAVARRISGSGVGLHVCREIISQHGGTIEVSSVEGQGSTFTVTLPLDRGVE